MLWHGELELARELGQNINELMGWTDSTGRLLMMTYRQFEVWMAWLRLQWNCPSRADYYAMQIAASNGAKGDLRIAFRDPEPKPEPVDPKDVPLGIMHPLTEEEVAGLKKDMLKRAFKDSKPAGPWDRPPHPTALARIQNQQEAKNKKDGDK